MTNKLQFPKPPNQKENKNANEEEKKKNQNSEKVSTLWKF